VSKVVPVDERQDEMEGGGFGDWAEELGSLGIGCWLGKLEESSEVGSGSRASSVERRGLGKRRKESLVSLLPSAA